MVGIFVQVKQYCPLCGAWVPITQAFGQPYECQRCGAKLQTCVRTSQRDALFAIVLATAVALVLGAKGWWIPVWSAVLWFPCVLAVLPVTLRYLPRKLEPWDGRKVV
jgi:uncharacterized protein (DUF983 family)